MEALTGLGGARECNCPSEPRSVQPPVANRLELREWMEPGLSKGSLPVRNTGERGSCTGILWGRTEEKEIKLNRLRVSGRWGWGVTCIYLGEGCCLIVLTVVMVFLRSLN